LPRSIALNHLFSLSELVAASSIRHRRIFGQATFSVRASELRFLTMQGRDRTSGSDRIPFSKKLDSAHLLARLGTFVRDDGIGYKFIAGRDGIGHAAQMIAFSKPHLAVSIATC
jgi:hypothetical protein